MMIRRMQCMVFMMMVLFSSALFAQQLDLSGLLAASKIPGTQLSPASDILNGTSTTQEQPTSFAWQVNAGWRLSHIGPTSILVELPFTDVPSQSSKVNAEGPGVTISTFFKAQPTYLLTPGVRFRFFNARFSPYAAAGYGFERSTEAIALSNGETTAFSASRSYKGVFDAGGGLDTKLVRILSVRVEVRDFIRSGQAISESRQNLVFLAGPVLHF
jgi:opacity protein-like surface antigen